MTSWSPPVPATTRTWHDQPAGCGGPWAKIVLDWTTSVQGRQFDRSGCPETARGCTCWTWVVGRERRHWRCWPRRPRHGSPRWTGRPACWPRLGKPTGRSGCRSSTPRPNSSPQPESTDHLTGSSPPTWCATCRIRIRFWRGYASSWPLERRLRCTTTHWTVEYAAGPFGPQCAGA